MSHILERRVPAMGGHAHVAVAGGTTAALDRAARRLAQLEQRWSRFRADSEISRLNRAAGRPCVVSADTYLLIHRSVEAWRATAGTFDPTVLAALEGAGYDRDFAELPADAGPAAPPTLPPGCAGIRLHEPTRLVFLPAGTGVDPGGIGKGLAADLVAEELLADGVAGACVNVGGDLRVCGDPPGPAGWIISVEDPADPAREMDRLQVRAGGVATSGTGYRRWTRAGRPMHHLIDPATGAPAGEPNQAATVLAGAGWWAEVMAKAALLAGPRAPEVLSRYGSTGAVVTAGGRWLAAPGYERFQVPALEAVG